MLEGSILPQASFPPPCTCREPPSISQGHLSGATHSVSRLPPSEIPMHQDLQVGSVQWVDCQEGKPQLRVRILEAGDRPCH